MIDTEEKEGLFKVKGAGNQSCWKFTSRSERLGEDPVQQNRQEVEKGERGGEKIKNRATRYFGTELGK